MRHGEPRFLRRRMEPRGQEPGGLRAEPELCPPSPATQGQRRAGKPPRPIWKPPDPPLTPPGLTKYLCRAANRNADLPLPSHFQSGSLRTRGESSSPARALAEAAGAKQTPAPSPRSRVGSHRTAPTKKPAQLESSSRRRRKMPGPGGEGRFPGPPEPKPKHPQEMGKALPAFLALPEPLCSSDALPEPGSSCFEPRLCCRGPWKCL